MAGKIVRSTRYSKKIQKKLDILEIWCIFIVIVGAVMVSTEIFDYREHVEDGYSGLFKKVTKNQMLNVLMT